MRKTNYTLLSSGRLQRFAFALVLVPIVCFCVLLEMYVVDVPWIDDIDAFLSFILGYIDAPTTAEKLDWLIRPNNEHRILTGKLITLAMYKLTGAVSYRWLVFMAFIFLLGLLYSFYRVFRSMNLPLVAFVPVPFLLLQPQFYLTSLWAITAMQHEVVIALVFSVLYGLAANERKRFGLALGVQLLASLSMSNGLFGWPAGAVVLALQRQWLRLAVWLVVGVATVVFYFHDFPNVQGNESSLSYFLTHPHLVFFGFFTFTGGLFDFISGATILWRSVLPTLAGFVLIPTMLWLLWRMNEPRFRQRVRLLSTTDEATKARWKRQYFFTGGYAFLMINAIIVAVFRPRFGYEVMLISNYMIYPAVLVILIYLNGLSEYRSERVTSRWVRGGVVVGLVVWTNWYIVDLPKIAARKHQILTFAFNQQYNHTGLGPSWNGPFMQLAQRILGETVRRGIYQYPQTYYTPVANKLLASGLMKPDTSLHLNIQEGGYSDVAATNYNDLPEPVGASAMIAQSAQRTYLFPSETPYTFANFYLRRSIRMVQGELIKPTMAPDHYRLGILTTSGNKATIRFSPQTVSVP